MGHRTPLDLHTVLLFNGTTCHIDSILAEGSNAILYGGWHPDTALPESRHRVLIRELFPYDSRGLIFRDDTGNLQVSPEAQGLWQQHKESYLTANEAHQRLLIDHPELSGAGMQCIAHNGTLYTLWEFDRGTALDSALQQSSEPLRMHTVRMLRLLDAVEAFHKTGSVHLDICPDTVMLTGSGDSEGVFLVDCQAVHTVGKTDITYFSRKPGYAAPELETGDREHISFASDLYSVAAIFFHCLMGRPMNLEELLQLKTPDVRSSPCLSQVPASVRGMVTRILKKGLQELPGKRYRSTGQMRQAFVELLQRIDRAGVTHWALWEAGRRRTEEWLRSCPSAAYASSLRKLAPICLQKPESPLTPEAYLQQGKRYSPSFPAVTYISLQNRQSEGARFIRHQILAGMNIDTSDEALSALQQMLESATPDAFSIVLLLDWMDSLTENTEPLMQELAMLRAMPGVYILSANPVR